MKEEISRCLADARSIAWELTAPQGIHKSTLTVITCVGVITWVGDHCVGDHVCG